MQLSMHQFLRNSHMLNDAKYNYFWGILLRSDKKCGNYGSKFF